MTTTTRIFNDNGTLNKIEFFDNGKIVKTEKYLHINNISFMSELFEKNDNNSIVKHTRYYPTGAISEIILANDEDNYYEEAGDLYEDFQIRDILKRKWFDKNGNRIDTYDNIILDKSSSPTKNSKYIYDPEKETFMFAVIDVHCIEVSRDYIIFEKLDELKNALLKISKGTRYNEPGTHESELKLELVFDELEIKFNNLENKSQQELVKLLKENIEFIKTNGDTCTGYIDINLVFVELIQINNPFTFFMDEYDDSVEYCLHRRKHNNITYLEKYKGDKKRLKDYVLSWDNNILFLDIGISEDGDNSIYINKSKN